MSVGAIRQMIATKRLKARFEPIAASDRVRWFVDSRDLDRLARERGVNGGGRRPGSGKGRERQ